MVFLSYVFIFIFGAVFGSFLSAYTYRIVNSKSVMKGRSICPKCKKKISWYDNIPLLSFFILRGKCRNCGKNISFRYPMLELATGMLFVGLLKKYLSCVDGMISSDFAMNDLICSWVDKTSLLSLVIGGILIIVFVAVFIIDTEHMIIPDSLIFPSFLLFYVIYSVINSADLFTYLLSGFSVSLFLLLLHLITLGKGMGLGDVKLALFSGFVLGFPLTLVWIFLSFILGSIVGVLLLFLNKAKFGKQIPFGPYLVMSFILVLFFGSTLLDRLNLPF